MADKARYNFKKSIDNMIATNVDAYNSIYSYHRADPVLHYSKEEAERIIRDGSPDELRLLSRTFFYISGYYRKLMLYYATILNYSTLVIPKRKDFTKSLSPQLKNKYAAALDLIDNLKPKSLFTSIALKIMVEGAYYGFISTSSDGKKNIINLPYNYCRSRFKTYEGIDVVEFDLTYFDQIYNIEGRIACLKTYPPEIREAYNQYHNNGGPQWFIIEPANGIHFNIGDERPLLAAVIPAIIDFNDYRIIEKAKDQQELQKILVQEMPHLNDGELVFEPEEAYEMHRGVVEMLKNTDGVDVLTSFGDVDVKDLQSTRSVITNNLEKISDSVYSEAGVSKQLFAAEGNVALQKSIDNDTAIAMIMGNQFANWLEYLINNEYKSSDMSFSVAMLPITFYNQADTFKNSLQGIQYGYSVLVPALCQGFTQSDFVHLKDLETNILKLNDLLVPLSSSNTQSGDENKSSTRTVGDNETSTDINKTPLNKKSDEDKADGTIANDNSGGE